jgi:hypothetical protein
MGLPRDGWDGSEWRGGISSAIHGHSLDRLDSQRLEMRSTRAYDYGKYGKDKQIARCRIGDRKLARQEKVDLTQRYLLWTSMGKSKWR